MFHKVTNVYPLDNYRLLVYFEDGASKIYDVRPLFEWKDVFKTLKENELFYRVIVEQGGYGVSWNDDVDISSEELYSKGINNEVDIDEFDLQLASEADKDTDDSCGLSIEELKKCLKI